MNKVLKDFINGLRWILWPLSVVHGSLAFLRRHFYSSCRKTIVKAKVLSVGNLSVGGSGKTPTILWLAQELSERGLQVGVVVRAYRARQQEPAIVNSQRTDLGPAQYGDEAWWLAQKLPDMPIVCGQNKAQMAVFFSREFPQIQWLLVDDGFQHLALHRDVDLLLLPRESSRERWPLPTGRAREFFGTRYRADFWLKQGQVGSSSDREFFATFVSGRSLSLGSAVSGTPALAFCGLARPDAFFAELQSRYPQIQWQFKTFRDHHPYSAKDVHQLRASGAKLFATTEKDFVKLRTLWQTKDDLQVISYEIDVQDGKKLIDAILCKAESAKELKGQ